jgi:hypothetical protein
MEGILALMIPVLALATGLVAVIRMPPEALASRRGRTIAPPAHDPALAEEVSMLREELAQVRERLDFTERLLMDAVPAQRLAAPASADALRPAAVPLDAVAPR